MAQKVKTASPYFLILFLVGLLISFNFWTSRVEAGDTSTTAVTVGNSAPVVSSVSLNSGDAIVLIENNTETVLVTGLVTDNNGCADVQDGSYKAYIYESGVDGKASCSADTDNCYHIASCSTDPRNTCTGGDDTSFLVTCTTNLQYFASPSDGSSSSSADVWEGIIVATDASGADHSASNSSQTIDVGLLRALEVSSSIDYTTLSADSDTGSSPIEMGIENTGNSGMNPLISATTTLICSTGACDTETIADANQQYASVSTDYDDAYNASLSGTPTSLELALPRPESDTYPVDATIFWGLGIDAGQTIGDYAGVNTFTAAGD